MKISEAVTCDTCGWPILFPSSPRKGPLVDLSRYSSTAQLTTLPTPSVRGNEYTCCSFRPGDCSHCARARFPIIPHRSNPLRSRFLGQRVSKFGNPRNSANFQAHIPRVYVSDSTLFDRWTDMFRLIFRTEESISKGYRMVPCLSDVLKTVPKRFLPNQVLERIYRRDC
jgi:hypothetical protein